VNKNLALGALFAGSPVIANVGKDYIIPKIPIRNSTIKRIAQKAISSILSDIAIAGLERVLYSGGSETSGIFLGAINR
jgi:hypothetical protein